MTDRSNSQTNSICIPPHEYDSPAGFDDTETPNQEGGYTDTFRLKMHLRLPIMA